MFEVLNNSKLFIGIMMIVMNLWSRYLVDELSGDEDEYNRNIILRRVAVFAVCFTATREIESAVLLTAGFVIIASGVSRRSREGMKNKSEPGKFKVDAPGYDESAPPLFS